ncbi:MAG: type II toxin-antitoxin system RelE/ParE family toxin [Pirellulales bacterium]|nr:type II toxin-antitoxin system RelE/ParE family toxin [Pirellulales bacterium]
MSFRVQLSSRARREFFDAAGWWAEHRDVDQAARWIGGLEAKIESLRDDPLQHPVIHEHDLYEWKHTYRRILFGLGRRPTHRAIYRVDDDLQTVFVVSIRHASQADIAPEDVE